MKVFKVILSALFPQKCVSCGRIVESEEYLCDYCYEMIEHVDITKVCERCGVKKSACQCQSRVFHFAGCAAPFENDGVAQAVVYRYKFARATRCGRFLAEEMAKTVRTVYRDIEFDGIAYVPMHPRKQLKRGFNQSEELAKQLSKLFDLRLYDRLLWCKYRKTLQHDMNFKERFNNVKGMYRCNYKVTGKTILLVDDIKTTGATLDECSKQLLFAGAKRVYCVTSLMSRGIDRNKKKGEDNGN